MSDKPNLRQAIRDYVETNYKEMDQHELDFAWKLDEWRSVYDHEIEGYLHGNLQAKESRLASCKLWARIEAHRRQKVTE